MRDRILIRTQILSLGLLFAAAVAPLPAQAWTFKVIHSFCAKPNCTDGAKPLHMLIDAAGNLFGLTNLGGKGAGAVFELSPDGSNGWKYHVLYSPSYGGTSPLIMDLAGNFYGTTLNDGKYFGGSVFELLRPQDGEKWDYKTLYSFCKVGGAPDCLDGRYTQAGLTYAGQASGGVYDGVSPLFGSTYDGGGAAFPGVVFRLQPDGAGKWRYKVIDTFCSEENCNDGAHPGRDGVVADAEGNLFGTTRTRGANNNGTVFALRVNQAGKKWREHTLHAFCSKTNCADGSWGSGGLLIDAANDLIGVTANGGNSCPQTTVGCGVLFRETPSGAHYKYRILHAFCAKTNCADGASPIPQVITDSAGTLFGTAAEGGGNNIDESGEGGGVVYAYGASFRVLHAFCAEANCADGEYPSAGVVMDAAGNLFGTTSAGGQYGEGVVYELSP